MSDLTVSVSCDMKINLGNYGSASVFLSVTGIAADSTVEQIDAALDTGKLAYDRIRERLGREVAALKGRTEAPATRAASAPRFRTAAELAAEAERLSGGAS